eukprot:CAMPEP_0168328396 /NCGR_PEP_ID=MMETSP0213-20121227/6469_1 /TAXON_ID=151035 /ORGANISM="Euplotes harpa, Strain FSP1.4" /LENGTH=100 /DNA_ID=CAMNT_0008331485 /DNA_START=24 /DNA_END=322 /DNA_ORIENTATION=+
MEGSAVSQDGLQAQIEQAQAQEAKKQEMEETTSAILKQILSPEARERLSNIKAAKPEKASQIQMLLIANLQAGRIQGTISEAQLIELIDQLNEKQAASTT